MQREDGGVVASNGATCVEVDGLEISYGPGVLRPRPWTAEQGRWAADLAVAAPPGPLLELHAGAGHIGLVAARRSGRPLVAVDDDLRACDDARRNAARAGLAGVVEVRHGDIASAIGPEERFPIVLADPPYLPSHDVHRHPDDPVHAVDGGSDGLERIRELLRVLPSLVAPGGVALVQLGGPPQVRRVRSMVPAPLRAGEARHWRHDRSVLQLTAADATSGDAPEG